MAQAEVVAHQIRPDPRKTTRNCVRAGSLGRAWGLLKLTHEIPGIDLSYSGRKSGWEFEVTDSGNC